jgi:hypothetical protein
MTHRPSTGEERPMWNVYVHHAIHALLLPTRFYLGKGVSHQPLKIGSHDKTGI